MEVGVAAAAAVAAAATATAAAAAVATVGVASGEGEANHRLQTNPTTALAAGGVDGCERVRRGERVTKKSREQSEATCGRVW